MKSVRSIQLVATLFIFCFSLSPVCSAETLFTPGPDKSNDRTHAFFHELLTQIVGDKYVIASRPHQTQNRSIGLLATKAYYDVIWTAESSERDETMLRIDFPIFRGALGIRGSIIRKDYEPYFNAITSIDEFKKVRLCQGHNWPDADILEYSGLLVYRAVHFESMLEMVSRERCDAIALSIFEGYGEMEAFEEKYSELTFSTSVLLIYPQSYYFYVKKENSALALLLEERLRLHHLSGDYDYLLSSHPLTRDAFPLSKYDTASKIIVQPGNAFFDDNDK